MTMMSLTLYISEPAEAMDFEISTQRSPRVRNFRIKFSAIYFDHRENGSHLSER